MTDRSRQPKPDQGWQADPYGLCRFRLEGLPRRECREPTVVSMRRGRTKRRYGYCEKHVARYGRVLRDGAVWWDPDAASRYREAHP